MKQRALRVRSSGGYRGELFRKPFAVDCFGVAEEPLRDCREVMSLPIDQVEYTRDSGGEFVHDAGSLGHLVDRFQRFAWSAGDDVDALRSEGLLQGAIETQRAPGVVVDGLAQLDV